MTNEAKDFTLKNPPKYKLKKFNDDITYLLKEGYTQAEILRYLEEYHNLKVSRATLTRQIAFIKKTKKEVKTEPQKKASESENKSTGARAYALPKTLNGSEFVAKVRSLGEPN
ncbi:MAG: hypothetical protein WC279_02670 [Sulfurimonas sp.]|jgi:hypothetical protein|uniref:hypothetical protein n=1 Tax=Sulfurimonas sp. TaxID=2022749 RepID=UPI003568434A